MPDPPPDRTVLGSRVPFLRPAEPGGGALVGVLLVLAADVWGDVLGPEAVCRARPTFFAAR